MKLERILETIKDDMDGVNSMLSVQLASDISLVNQISGYIIQSGGKRIRPIVVLLAARTLNYQGQHHLTTALFVELIHTATLLHDDVVDKSELRRSRATANTIFGNAASVLVGDFLYTRALQIILQIGSDSILELMASTTNILAEGEVMQLANRNDPDLSESSYLQMIYRKTASLFEAAAQSGALLAPATTEQRESLKTYGRHLGNAFQLVDDRLDYCSDETVLGKRVGDDLNDGKATLPLLHAMQHCTEGESQLIRQAIRHGSDYDIFNSICAIIQECGSLEYTQKCAEVEVHAAVTALQSLPANPYRRALQDLAFMVLERDY